MRQIPLDKTIETKRLLLRCRENHDNEMIFSATRYEGFNDGMLWDPPKNIQELEPRVLQAKENWKNGQSFQLVITRKENKVSIGMISIREIEMENQWNIGYFMHPKYQNKGYTTEACKCIIDFGFSELCANEIRAQHAIWNKASGKILQASGMKYIGFIPQGFMKKGKWIEENNYAITKDMWIKQKRV